MNILITGAATPLGQHLAAGLRAAHQLRLTDRVPVDTDLDFALSDLDHDDSTDQLVAGTDAIVHQPYLPGEGDGETAWIDASTRCTYNLLLAATQAGVQQVIYLSTLDLFLLYDEDMAVSEEWRPRPSCQPDTLGPHLGEFIAREFAHAHALKVLIVRLGHVVTAEETREKPFDPMWVHVRDVAGAVQAALQQELPDFSVFHLQARSEPSRATPGRRRRRSLRYVPQFKFEENV